MLSRNMQKGALIARDAYLTLLDLKSLVDLAVENTHMAGLDTVGLSVSPQPLGDPLRALKAAADTLHSPVFDSTVSEARTKVEIAMAWHQAVQH